MQLADRLETDAQPPSEPDGTTSESVLRVVSGWYETVERGYRHPMPVLHFNCRAADGAYRHVTVDGFRPYFYVSATTDGERLQALAADRRVRDVSRAEQTGVAQGRRDIPLARIEVTEPYHVAQLREQFDQTWEADVLFPERFLIDQGITAYMRAECTRMPLSPADVEPVDPSECPDTPIRPRIAHWDIEVATGDALAQLGVEGPDATEMPDPSAPARPLTAVGLYDATDESYTVVVLDGDWDTPIDTDGMPATVRLVDDERTLIQTVVRWFTARRPNVLTGWNANAFDWPYFINRAFYLGERSVTQLSPTGNVSEHEDGGRFVNSDVGGILLFDLLNGYKQSRYTELESHDLAHVSAVETDMPKLDVDDGWAYAHAPERFIEYNLRDVQATVSINEEVGLI